MKYNIGDLVTWQSQAQGSWITKAGTIAEVIPAGKLPDRVLFSSLYKSSGVGLPRNEESYVVTVAGKTTKAKPRAYWPHANKLNPVL